MGTTPGDRSPRLQSIPCSRLLLPAPPYAVAAIGPALGAPSEASPDAVPPGPRPPAVSPSSPSPPDRKNTTPRDLTLPPFPGLVPVHCFAGRQCPDRSDRPGSGGSVAHGRGGARGLRTRAGRPPSSLAGASRITQGVRGRGVIAPHEKPPDGELDKAAKGGEPERQSGSARWSSRPSSTSSPE